VRAIATLACALAGGAFACGCGGTERLEGPPDPATEPIDAPAKPPRGWRTTANRTSGFTISVPRSWSVRTRGTATLLRSRSRLVAVTIAADRSRPGRDTRAAVYARRAFAALPGFRRLAASRTRKVRGSPYDSALVAGAGTLRSRGQRQRVLVATFRRPGRVAYTAVAFAALVRGRAPDARALAKVLASLRGRRPAGL
jgi:hypothetical protein